MAGSIEFGILEEWSTCTLVPEFRVDMDNEEFLSLRSVLDRVGRQTGLKFDPYSSATIVGADLDVFIDEMTLEESRQSSTAALAGELVRCAGRAKQTGRSLEYRGL